MPTTLPDFDGLLNWERLNAWLETQDVPGKGPVTSVQQLTGGTQNNVFLMTRNGGSFVMRSPPRHQRANSNDTMLREARVLKALAGSDVPHPRFFAVCEDLGVIGACFYLMEPLEGYSPRGPLPGRYATEQSWRRQMGIEFVRAAAAISRLDYKAIGLEGYGKPQDWHARQVDRWRSQLDGYNKLPGYVGITLPHVDEVGRWLKDNMPEDRRMGLIHGDFQFPNAMFSLAEPKISGVIDWELSSLGDPIMDLGYVLASWLEPGDPEGKTPFVEPWDGFVSRAELIKLYGELSGRDMSILPWYFTLACYKQGCILEGSYARALAGQAPMATGERLHRSSIWLFKKAYQLMGKA